MELVHQFLDFLHQLVDVGRLNALVESMGVWFYVVLFVIVFCETGLVVTPFLPGDSMLFAVGAVAAFPNSPLSLTFLAVMLIVSGVIGDAVNYSIGRYLGPKVFSREDSRLLSKKHLLRAQRFYEDYGAKTIILARFIPIIRTFAPFVAGIGNMQYRKFAVYNVTGAVAWVLTFLLAGYFFGSTPWVLDNFMWVIVAIIVISVLPAVIEIIRAWRAPACAAKPEPVAVETTN